MSEQISEDINKSEYEKSLSDVFTFIDSLFFEPKNYGVSASKHTFILLSSLLSFGDIRGFKLGDYYIDNRQSSEGVIKEIGIYHIKNDKVYTLRG